MDRKKTINKRKQLASVYSKAFIMKALQADCYHRIRLFSVNQTGADDSQYPIGGRAEAFDNNNNLLRNLFSLFMHWIFSAQLMDGMTFFVCFYSVHSDHRR